MKFGLCCSSIEEAISYSQSHDITAAQIYLNTRLGKKDDRAYEMRALLSTTTMTIVNHANLQSNLVSEDKRKLTFSINQLLYEVINCSIIGIDTMVIHPGSSAVNSPKELADNLIMLYRKAINTGVKFPKICVENMVNSGTHIMTTPEDFETMFSALKEKDSQVYATIFMCYDTAHSWGVGISPTEWVNRCSSLNILDKLKVVHYNNTWSKYGSKKERHAQVSEGEIPVEELKALSARFKDSDIIFIEEQPRELDSGEVIKYLKECF